MPKSPKKDSLPEKDYLAILELILQFHDCRTRQELKTVLKDRLLPMLKAQDAAYFWTDPDISSLQALDLIGFPEKDKKLLEERIASNPLTNIVAIQIRPVVATGIDYSMEQMRKGAEDFFKTHPQYKWGNSPYVGRSQSIGLSDVPSTSVFITIQRPRPKAWTFREVRICELLRPHLIQAIKGVFLREELAQYKSLTEKLADVPTPTALLNPDMRVIFNNKAFAELLSVDAGKMLPKNLAEMVSKETARFEPPYQTDHPEIELSFLTLPQGVFCLCAVPLEGKAEQRNMLIRLKPVIEPMARMNLLMQSKGLTAKEMEICVLLKDGIDAKEIADRLFISIHTLRTHMRNIHGKMDVHSSAQLVAVLSRGCESENG